MYSIEILCLFSVSLRSVIVERKNVEDLSVAKRMSKKKFTRKRRTRLARSSQMKWFVSYNKERRTRGTSNSYKLHTYTYTYDSNTTKDLAKPCLQDIYSISPEVSESPVEALTFPHLMHHSVEFRRHEAI